MLIILSLYLADQLAAAFVDLSRAEERPWHMQCCQMTPNTVASLRSWGISALIGCHKCNIDSGQHKEQQQFGIVTGRRIDVAGGGWGLQDRFQWNPPSGHGGLPYRAVDAGQAVRGVYGRIPCVPSRALTRAGVPDETAKRHMSERNQPTVHTYITKQQVLKSK